MEVQNFLSIAAVGVALSLIVEMIKAKFGMVSAITKLLTLILATIFAGAYVFLRQTPYFETVITVLGTASIVYGFLFKSSNTSTE